MKTILFWLIIPICAQCQVHYITEVNLDTLNKYNSNGKKTGYWIEYVNEKFLPEKNTKKAVFFRYVYFDNGFKINAGPQYSSEKKTIIEGNRIEKGKIIALSGTYKLYDRKGRLVSEDVYKDGKPMWGKSYFKKGMINEELVSDYSNKHVLLKIKVYDRKGAVVLDGIWKHNGKKYCFIKTIPEKK